VRLYLNYTITNYYWDSTVTNSTGLVPVTSPSHESHVTKVKFIHTVSILKVLQTELSQLQLVLYILFVTCILYYTNFIITDFVKDSQTIEVSIFLIEIVNL
jgi:uncharacterized membrane protein (DUF485 family)